MKKLLIGISILSLTFLVTSCDSLEDAIDAFGSFDDVQEDFEEIAELTGGEQIDAKGADEIPEKILEIIDPAQGKVLSGSDVIFLIDKTGSMENDIDEVKDSLSTILNSAPEGTLFSIGAYGDKNEDGDQWYSISSNTPSSNTTELQSFLDDLTTTGGGDWPESVYDAIWKTIDEVQWQSQTQRIIIVIGDASPLTGSKTTYTLDDVVEKSKETDPEINLYTIAVDD